jgi:hypothetical protein
MMAAHDMVRHPELIAQRQHHILVAGGVDYFMPFSVQSLCYGTEEMNVGRMAEVDEDTHGRGRGTVL